MSKKTEEFLEQVDASKRSLLKKVLTAGAAVYVAPVVASFSLSGTFDGALHAHGGNQELLCHPILGGPFGRTVLPTEGHLAHGDAPAFGATGVGQLCKP